MVKRHGDSGSKVPNSLVQSWFLGVPFQRNHRCFSWCFTCQATFGNFDPYEAQVVDQVAAAFGYGLNNKDEGYFYSNNQVRIEPEEVVKLKTWSWSHLGWCCFVELQRPDEQPVFTMACSLWFSSFDSSGGRVVLFSFMVLDFASFLVWLESWICGLDGSFPDLELKLWISRDTIPTWKGSALLHTPQRVW